MSEYQYYEFQAIDKPLTAHQMQELGKLSSRASITSANFTNSYSWGDFSGNPHTLMKKYFDAFLYLANWGTHWFMLRLPRNLMAPEVARQYCFSDCASVQANDNHVILEFRSEDEYGEWIEEGDGWLSSLIHLRTELLNGDSRCLYLAWLLSAQEGELEDDEQEPPVPPNLNALSASLQRFAEFLRIDEDLIKVAAKNSNDLQQKTSSTGECNTWISRLPQKEKREQERAAARKVYLQSLKGKKQSLWKKVADLIETKQAKGYEKAILLLNDLHEFAEMEGAKDEFSLKINALCSEHTRKSALLIRLREAGLNGTIDDSTA